MAVAADGDVGAAGDVVAAGDVIAAGDVGAAVSVVAAGDCDVGDDVAAVAFDGQQRTTMTMRRRRITAVFPPSTCPLPQHSLILLWVISWSQQQQQQQQQW